ncbi:MAG: acyl-CoA thioesterase II [Xanthomonadales bacterium]|nr:acyl-CoA thioesterase II [Xanthomonadales bacterium]
MEPMQHLLKYFELEKLEENLYRGQSLDIGTGRIFGGQVLSQALGAAYRTVEDKHAHSFHAYFLREGDVKKPVVFQVDRARDGRSFDNRRVVAIQHGRPILNLAASFQIEESGYEHQVDAPDLPKPDELDEKPFLTAKQMQSLTPRMRRLMTTQGPFEFRFADDIDPFDLNANEPIRQIWFRARTEVPMNQALHRQLMAFVSDFHLVATSTFPHPVSYLDPTLQIASLDHAMWFHHDLNVNDWLLYDCFSPVASQARGFAQGRVFTLDGKLVAHTSQQGLIRQRDKARDGFKKQD